MWRAYPRHSVNLSGGCYAAALRALTAGRMLRGPELGEFEKRFAEFIGVRHAVGVSSGRAAIHLALRSLRLDEGDEVLVSGYNFHIVPLVIRATGLKPVLVDVTPDSYNIDVAEAEKKIGARTKAIIATHMYGQPCDLEAIRDLAQSRGLRVIEDCAHACGAVYHGRNVGSFGDLGAFTFAMAKNMPCFGGGMITTDSDELYERLRGAVRPPEPGGRSSLAKELLVTTINYLCTRPPIFPLLVHPVMRLLQALGQSALDSKPGQERVSATEVQSKYPIQMANLQAAVGLHQLTRIDQINAATNRNALTYNGELKELATIRIPAVGPDRTHTFLYYRIETDDRQSLRQKLQRRGVDTNPDDMSDCSTLPDFREEGFDLPVARRLPQKILEIPNNPYLREADVRYIARCLRESAA